ncbi:hypothetical protein B0H14DRAFT_2634281 [Mycena olivaceomarginata]|nr:hypothetical protein B0H14DRAFT_2634281 [Mycena olivaceomarginata]
MMSMVRLCRTWSWKKPVQGKTTPTIECPYEFRRNPRDPPYPPRPNLIYGHIIKEESPLPQIKPEAGVAGVGLMNAGSQALCSSARVVQPPKTLTAEDTDYSFDNDSPDVSPAAAAAPVWKAKKGCPPGVQDVPVS